MNKADVLRRVAGLGLVLLLAGGGWWAWQRYAPASVPAGLVSANGRLEAVEVDVATRYAGRLARLQAQEGDELAAGAEVGALDLTDLQAQLLQAQAQKLQAEQAVQQARAGVAQTAASAALARASLARTEELVGRGFVSAQQLDRDRSNLQVAEATAQAAQEGVRVAQAAVGVAEAGIQRVQAALDDSRLLAPVAGRVLFRLQEPGAVLAAGARVLTLLDFSDVHITVFLPAADAGRLRLGGEARIVLDAWPGEPLPARVSFIADEAQFTPRAVETRDERAKLMFRVKLQVDEDWVAAHRAVVKPGMPGIAWLRVDPAAPWPARLPAR